MAELIGMHETSRGVLRLAGGDARAVLQGVVTNDVDRVVPGCAVYAALLTPQGKYLSDFFLLDGGDGDLLIDVAVAQAPALAKKLQMYALRRDATLSVEQGCEIGLAWEPPAAAGPPLQGLDGPEGSTRPTRLPPPAGAGGVVVEDPRDPALGWRRYGADTATWLAEAGIAGAQLSDRDDLRIAHIVPESGIELVSDETYVLEAGFERLGGVDFSKGCYVGQEVTARMKHKTELRKGLVQVAVTGEAKAGTPITAAGKPAGTLFTQAGARGLAHLRLDRAGEGMEAAEAKVSFPT